MYLVFMHIFATNKDIPCVITKTREKAQEYIDNIMKDVVYSGTIVYKIKQIELYE